MTRSFRWGGAAELLVATVTAGVAGYAITWIVFRWIGPAAYATFAVYWAALYLIIGALSGVQQEVARATRPIERGTRTTASRSRNLALIGPLVVAVLIGATSPTWGPTALGGQWGALVVPLAVGTGSYVAVAVLAGSLYGVRSWGPIAFMLVADPVLRLAALLVALLFTHDMVVLAWCVSLPLFLVPIGSWFLIRRRLVNVTEVDAGYRRLVWNVARTVLASSSTAVMVSGFPLIVGLTSRSVSAALIGNVVFAITLTRAPLIVGVMAMQSYLLVRFRDAAETARRTLLLALGLLALAAVVLGAIGALIGAPVIDWISGERSGLDGGFVATLVVSSAAVAALSVTGSAILARSGHLAYLLGWLVAAVTTIVIMMVPIDFLPRIGIALVVGPVAGLLVHGVALVRMPPQLVGEVA